MSEFLKKPTLGIIKTISNPIPFNNKSYGVKDTTKLTVRYDEEENKHVNNYQVLLQLGMGAFGKVKLVCNMDTDTNYVITTPILNTYLNRP